MPGFEEQLAALEGVIERLERGDLTLEQSVDLFEQGLRLSNACKQQLDSAEGRIQVLVDGGNGKAKLAELEIDDDGIGDSDEEDAGASALLDEDAEESEDDEL